MSNAEAPREVEVQRTYKIKCSDGTMFTVAQNIISQSNLVKTKIQEFRLDAELAPNQSTIELFKVDGRTFQKVLDWCEYHVDKPVEPTIYGMVLSTWDTNYVKMSHSRLEELMKAVNYLDIPGLKTVCSQAVCNMTNGMATDQLMRYFLINEGEADPTLQQGTSGSS